MVCRDACDKMTELVASVRIKLTFRKIFESDTHFKIYHKAGNTRTPYQNTSRYKKTLLLRGNILTKLRPKYLILAFLIVIR